MSKIDTPLTDMQREFVKIYAESEGQLSKTECAKLAGYDEKSAYQRGYELTNPRIYPNVVREISKHKTEYLEKYGVNEKNHIARLGKLRDMAEAKGMVGVAVRAEELRGKVRGLYIEKTMSLNKHSLEDLTSEELEEKMREIQDTYSEFIDEKKKNKNV